jgi:endonuclease/exonuclease/phosphatase family metal-dependent hydrolase
LPFTGVIKARSPTLPRWLLLVSLVLVSVSAQASEHIKVTTWNLEWFPNGSPKQLPVEEQQKRIDAAAEVLKRINPDVLLLQEVSEWQACERLVAAIGKDSYQIAVCSASKTGRQQQAILAKQPAIAAWSESWKVVDAVDPARGFAFAWLKFGSQDVGFYCVHLKSNLVMHGDKEAANKLNIHKREMATEQLISHIKGTVSSGMPSIKTIVIGGDFNTNKDQELFQEERTFNNLRAHGFQNSWDGIPLEKRITHPGGHGFPDCTFDYLFTMGVKMQPPVVTSTLASDHLPVTVEIKFP